MLRMSRAGARLFASGYAVVSRLTNNIRNMMGANGKRLRVKNR